VKVLLGAKGNRVQQEVQSPEGTLDLIENAFKGAVGLNVERQQEPWLKGLRNRRHERHGSLLAGEYKLGPGVTEGLRATRGDRVFIRDTRHEADFAAQEFIQS
jgi:hypothetical protein